jgi:serine/threonine protein kinase
MELIGAEIKGYRILEPMGGNGTSTLYKAATPDGEGLVAIKFFPSELSRYRNILEKMRETFLTLSRINHPGIPPVMNFNIHEGYPFIIMPYLAAGSLKDRIEFGALAATNAEAVIGEVAAALDKAHSKGLVHGDLNPSHIHFDENGKVQIIGFGEAPILRVISQGEHIDERTFDYRAPEVIRGGESTPRSDQYSLGLIALQLVSRLPADEALRALEFHRENGKEFRTRPNHLAIALPSKVIDVLSRALSMNPSDRFPSIKAMFHALEGAIWKETPADDQQPVREKASSEKRNYSRILAFAIAIIIVLCLFAIEPALTMQGDLKFANLLSTIGLNKSHEMTESTPESDGTAGNAKVATLPPDVAIVVGDVDIQLTNPSPTESTEVGEGGNLDGNETATATSVMQLTPIPSATAFAPTSTQIIQATPTKTVTVTPTVTLTATSTEPPPTSTITPISPDRCSSYPRSDRYCTPTPTSTRSSEWCSSDPHSHHYCTPTPTNTHTPVPPTPTPTQWCSSHRWSDHYCTPTPTP